MALDISTDLDFGVASQDLKASAIIVLCLSICFGLLAGYQFRLCCCQNDHFKNSAQRVFERDMKKYSKRVNKYREHASDDDEKPVHKRQAPIAGEFHDLQDDPS
jgi:hypothetical protein